MYDFTIFFKMLHVGKLDKNKGKAQDEGNNVV